MTEHFISQPQEHVFAQYVRILGRGKTGSRALSRDEARRALGMILDGTAQPVQVGAFLMLLRVKEESAEELAGFVEASRQHIAAPRDIQVDLDWSSYAGKLRQLPWYLVAALALAHSGVRVFMHGASGHTAGRLYTAEALRGLGIEPARDWQEVRGQLDSRRFSFMPLEELCPPLQALMDLRQQFGLRSPVHSLARLLNPLGAGHSLQSIFHPSYADSHQSAAALLGQPHAAVFKGEAGEVEYRPEARTRVYTVHDGVLGEEQWPQLQKERQPPLERLDIQHLRGFLQGRIMDAYGRAASVGTIALALRLLDASRSMEAALGQAELLLDRLIASHTSY